MAEEKKDKKFIKPAWLPRVLLGAELAIVFLIGALVISTAM